MHGFQTVEFSSFFSWLVPDAMKHSLDALVSKCCSSDQTAPPMEVRISMLNFPTTEEGKLS